MGEDDKRDINMQIDGRHEDDNETCETDQGKRHDDE